MKEPNVPMYSTDMIQVWASRAASLAAPVSFLTEARLSIRPAASTAARRISGM